MTLDDAIVRCGFYKTEYVRAKTDIEAIAKAKSAVLDKLAKNSAIVAENTNDVSLTPEEVESGVPVWKLVSSEGFVFYRAETQDQ